MQTDRKTIIMKKTNIFKTLAVAAAMMFTAQNANAQLEQSVFLQGGLPTADFNSKVSSFNGLFGKEDIAKDVSLGLGLGYRCGYLFDIGFGEVMPFVSADLFWNRTNGTYRDDFMNAGYKVPNYINVAPMLGVNYRYGLTDIITVFGEFGVGYDAFLITAEGSKGESSTYLKYKTTGALAWQVGVGSYFGRHVSLGIHYYGLGRHYISYNGKRSTINGTAINDYPSFDNTNEGRNLGTLALRIGFHF